MSPTVSRAGWIAILMLAVVSCQKPVPATLDKPIDLAVGRAATFQEGDLDLYFRRVVTDSRCPRDVQCITAGEAFVALECRSPTTPPESFEVRLQGGEDSINGTTYNGYSIRLVELKPHPVAGVTPDTAAYIGTFIVEKR